jgi:hypothetical protein
MTLPTVKGNTPSSSLFSSEPFLPFLTIYSPLHNDSPNTYLSSSPHYIFHGYTLSTSSRPLLVLPSSTSPSNLLSSSPFLSLSSRLFPSYAQRQNLVWYRYGTVGSDFHCRISLEALLGARLGYIGRCLDRFGEFSLFSVFLLWSHTHPISRHYNYAILNIKMMYLSIRRSLHALAVIGFVVVCIWSTIL